MDEMELLEKEFNEQWEEVIQHKAAGDWVAAEEAFEECCIIQDNIRTLKENA